MHRGVATAQEKIPMLDLEKPQRRALQNCRRKSPHIFCPRRPTSDAEPRIIPPLGGNLHPKMYISRFLHKKRRFHEIYINQRRFHEIYINQCKIHFLYIPIEKKVNFLLMAMKISSCVVQTEYKSPILHRCTVQITNLT